MKILFVADGRSPIALNWMRYFVERGDEVHLASTFACNTDIKFKSVEVVPVAFSRAKSAAASAPRRTGIWRNDMVELRTAIRHWVGPLTLGGSAKHLRKVIARIKPDIIHAMRIPFEGILAAQAYSNIPLVVSVWGDDFTLHAKSTPLMDYFSKQAMKKANALHSDCHRDIRIGKEYGFREGLPTLVVPGNGGVRRDVFHPLEKMNDAPVVINPRGFRICVRNDIFFQAIKLVLKEIPETKIYCASMAGQAEAEKWIKDLGIEKSVTLLAPQPHFEMAKIFREAAVTVSPSTHDGTPNTLLEAMASGCLPVVGELESIREWITDGENGLLIDPANVEQMTNAILRGLKDHALRKSAAEKNAKIIAERAEYESGMAKAGEFYTEVVQKFRGA